MAQNMLKRFPLLWTQKPAWTSGTPLNRMRECRGEIWLRHLSNTTASVDNRGRNDYRLPMWKRLKKNDPNIEDFLSSNNTQNRIEDLSKLMRCSFKQATELIKRDSPLGVTDVNNLHKKIEILMSNEYTAEDIISNPAVLHRTYEVLQSRLGKLNRLNKHISKQLSLALLKKSDPQFKAFVTKCQEEEKFSEKYSSPEHYLSTALDLKNTDEARKLIEENQLDTVSIVLLKNKIELMESFNISTDVIQDLIKVLANTSLLVLKDRLNHLYNSDVLDHPGLKLGWLLSSKNEVFLKSANILKENLTALEGCKTKEDYLVRRLKCSKKVAKHLVDSQPLKSMSELKCKNMLDFFLQEMQVSADFVISNVHLFGFSLERFQHRWLVVKDRPTSQIPRLYAMTDEKFQKFVSV